MNIKLILDTNYTGSQWALIGNEYDGLTWLSDDLKPTEAELLAQWPAVESKAAYDAVSFARAAAYAAVGGSDGIFFQYQRGEATEQEWLDAVQAINDANPYPVKDK